MADWKKVLKFTMMVKRKEGMSEEEFNKHWTEVHTPIVTDWLARHGVIRYAQYHTPSRLRAQSETAFQAPNTASISDFDGHVELTVPNIEALQSAFNDPYWKEHVEPDEQKFFDAATTVRTMGWEEVKIEGGEIVG